jgi:hypothetical protein
MLCLLKNYIILPDVIINVNILIIAGIKFYLCFAGVNYRNIRATAYNFEFDLHTLSIY